MTKFSCFVDGKSYVYDTCVIDAGDVTGCTVCSTLISQGKLKEDCPHWKEVIEEKFNTVETDTIVCPYCGSNEIMYEDGREEAWCSNCDSNMKISVKVLYTTEKLGKSEVEM